jgi:integrase
MRQGELLGLQWKGLNLDAGILTVNRSVYEDVISPPKTIVWRRTMRLSKVALAALRKHRVNAAKVRISEWVLPNTGGTPNGHQNLHNRSWNPC